MAIFTTLSPNRPPFPRSLQFYKASFCVEKIGFLLLLSCFSSCQSQSLRNIIMLSQVYSENNKAEYSLLFISFNEICLYKLAVIVIVLHMYFVSLKKKIFQKFFGHAVYIFVTTMFYEYMLGLFFLLGLHACML